MFPVYSLFYLCIYLSILSLFEPSCQLETPKRPAASLESSRLQIKLMMISVFCSIKLPAEDLGCMFPKLQTLIYMSLLLCVQAVHFCLCPGQIQSSFFLRDGRCMLAYADNKSLPSFWGKRFLFETKIVLEEKCTQYFNS